MISRQFLERNIDELKFDLSLDLSVDFTKWLIAIVYDAYKASPDSEHIILEKLTHIFSTVVQGRRILLRSENLPLDGNVADLACLLHDIGRFKETAHNEHLVGIPGFDHASYGAEIFEQHTFMNYPFCESNKKVIAEAIKEHDKHEYVGNNLYAKLVRDADKLDNLININFQIENSSAVLKGRGVTKLVLEKFLAKEQIPPTAVISEADFIIYLSSWFYDINFAATRLLLKEAGVVDTIVQKLKLFGASDHEANEIRAKLTS